ncbi:WD40-repeat-containing domain protein [Calycina marina]|uniref:Polyadenylation factor subunit 2 n=1 Tax=Calycina marina TaxID=1763456 RepID=A0A9P7YYU2_9HELO|nr:WD40-repeat-containing domain protein [Calycina marina]
MANEQRDYGGGGGGGGLEGGGFQPGFGRGRGKRAITDYGSTMVHWMRNRQPRYKGGYQGEMERPSPSYIIDMLPPLARPNSPADSIPARHLHSSLNKIKHPVNVVKWTPEGRRLLTGSSSGEFTLWNGMAFNFETIMQAHDVAIRAMSYSHSDDWLISADQDGLIKYWEPNFNNVKVIQGHSDAIRDLAFSPTDTKFVTASDDSTLKIFDFAGGVEESTLTGHGWDAKCVDWHPTKGLLVSGSKDHLVKLWDPRTSRCLTTLHGHKNTITKTLFERVRGQCLATSARDQTARVFDLRMMRDICLLKGHEKDIATIAWHPIHSSMLSTGGNDGSLFHYLLDEPNTPAGVDITVPPYEADDPTTASAQTIYPAHKINYAHDFAIWSLDWHPLGHILASGSNDRVTRFWTRARPGDTDVFQDRYHIGEAAAEQIGTWDRRKGRDKRQEEEEREMEDEKEGLVDQKMPPKQNIPLIPGLPMPGTAPRLPGLGSALPPPPYGFAKGVPPPPLPGMDPAKLAEMFKNGHMPPPGHFPPGFVPPPPPPPGYGVNGYGQFPPPPAQFQNAEEPPAVAGSVRRRGPLPSQEESLRMEQQRGQYTHSR